MVSEEPLTIVIAEEQALVREGLVRLCEAMPGFSVVGHYGSGSAALRTIREKQPDFALLDLNLSDLFALEIVRQVRVATLKTRTVVLSMRRDRKTVLEALRCGASGYLLKSNPSTELFEAFRHMQSGAVYVTPSVEINAVFGRSAKDSGGDPIEALSAREYQVFTLLVEGIRAKEIAARLELSPKTVDTYRASLMRKLDIHDVAGLVKFAIGRDMA
jgi:DNA-binding NarL/FixJ family response regulator